jgi:tRNA 5-methylaminomethyl-2-thiouridine biosynthesis bifunctional protein
MWSPQLMQRLSRLARPGTTIATYSSAGSVRQGLEAAGFALEKCPGFGRKRDMLRGCYAPRWPSRRPREHAPGPSNRHAIVIGAGLAGAAVTERLASRGWKIDLIERRAQPAAQTRGLYAGVFHPHVSSDDCILSRTARNGFLYAIARWLALEQAGQALAWGRCGVLQISGDGERDQCKINAIAALGYPHGYAQYIERGAAETLTGCRLSSGGWWFSGGGWMRPPALIAAQLATAGGTTGGAALTPHFGVDVRKIARSGGEWQALAADGTRIAAAPVLVLANSHDITRLASIAQPLKNIRGQVTYLPAANIVAPRVVLAGKGYVLPAADAVVVTGSTYDHDNDDPAPQVQGHEANLLRLAQLLPHARVEADAAKLDGAVGFRCVAPDRMPLVGAIPDVDAARAQQGRLSGAQLSDLPRCPGLYCASAYASRGLVWAALAGELLASLIEGEPLPLEGDLADALDPGRFVLRQVRHGTL